MDGAKAQDEAKTVSSKVIILSRYSFDWSLLLCSIDIIVVDLGQLVRYLKVIHNHSSTEVIVEQVQRPALDIEANLRPAASIHVGHGQIFTLAESLPE